MILISLILLLTFCKKPHSEEINFTPPYIFVGNEGNFTYGNSSLTYINEVSDSVLNTVFMKKNGFPLGDILESLTLWDNKIFAVVNNSGKIYVLDPQNAKYSGSITELTSPRYILVTDSSKAFISDLYANYITIINPTTLKRTGQIKTGCPTETMQKYDDFVFVTNWNNGNKLLKIDIKNNTVIDSVILTKQPNSLQIDKYGRLWVLSDGGMNPDTSLDEMPALTCIDPSNDQILKILHFDNIKSSPVHLCINETKDTLYYINSSWNENIENSGIYKFCVNDSVLPQKIFITEGNRQFYGLAVKNGKIYVTDAKDFVQPGELLIYSQKGNLIKKYNTGINPSSLLFYE